MVARFCNAIVLQDLSHSSINDLCDQAGLDNKPPAPCIDAAVALRIPIVNARLVQAEHHVSIKARQLAGREHLAALAEC